MIERPEEVRARLNVLTAAAWAASAVGFLLESGLVDHLQEPRSAIELAALAPPHTAARIARVLAVLEAEGFVVRDGERYRSAPGLAPFSGGPPRASLQGEVRGTLLQAVEFLDSAQTLEAATGWRHTSPALLQAQGDASSALPGMFKGGLLPTLGDLSERLEREGASFLDVGVGVAALAIAMCRAYPRVRVVGLDVHEPALDLARANVARAGLEARVELRRTPVEGLRDQAAFDLAWVPTFFLPSARLAEATARVAESLRPGGWILFAASCHEVDGDPRRAAAHALITDLWGGTVFAPEEPERLLRESGFVDLRRAPGPGGAPAMFVGRRA